MRPLLALLGIALAGCQPTTVHPGGSPGALEQALAGRAAGGRQTCISTQPNQNLRVIDAATVGYEVGATLWINRLRAACPSLSPYNIILIERDGAQICRGDRVRGLEPGATIPGAGCNLQDWTPYRSR